MSAAIAGLALDGGGAAKLLDRISPPGAARSADHDSERVARLVWGVLGEPGDGVAGLLVDTLGAARSLDLVWRPGTADEARAGAPAVLRRVAEEWPDRDVPAGVLAGFLRWAPRMSETRITPIWRMAQASDAHFVMPGDPQWPALLDDLGPHRPFGLWVRGDPGLLARLDPAIGMVGSRTPTGYGNHVASELAAELAGRGFAIVSGAAYGIDGAAHRAALASGALTGAVLAGGIDRFYPAGHEDLLTRIVHDGVVVSEAPFGVAPTAWRFLQRNRLIAALSRAVVVVEAATRSGALNTASHALALGRPLGAVPGPITAPLSAGCHLLIRDQGAALVASADDVVELAGFDAREALPREADDPRRGRAQSALSTRTPRTVDEIAARSGLSADDAGAVLGLLALEGLARRSESGWVSVPQKR